MFSLRRKFFSLLIAVIIVICMMNMQGSVVQAAGISYYVDGTNGNDNNDGRSTGLAFKTIQKAAALAQAGDTVYIRGGTYREAGAVIPANSGTSEANRIKFTNYNGESVTVTGAEPVGGWTQESSNIYYAPMNWNLNDKNQIFINSVMVNEARWPNGAGTVLATPDSNSFAVVDDINGKTQIIDTSLTGSNNSWNGATLFIIPGLEWVVQTSTVTAYDAVSHTLSFNKLKLQSPYGWPTAYDPTPGNFYYLSGLKSMLDSQNEWWFDTVNLRLYIYSATAPSNVEAKKRDVAFDLSDRSYITVEGLSIMASTIRTNDNTSDCLLKKLTCKYLSYSDSFTDNNEQNGMGITLYGSNNVLRDSELRYGSSSLVGVYGSYNSVINCYIHDSGYVPTFDSLVELRGKYSLISHNTISDYGSRILGSNGFPVYKNSIQYNRIYNGGWFTKDMGLIYFPDTDGQGTEIHHNIISDNKSRFWGWGIYLDSYCYNFNIHHNIIYNIPNNAAVSLSAPSAYNLVCNNTAWYNVGRFQILGPELTGTGLNAVRVFNNISPVFYFDGTSPDSGSNLTSNLNFTNESSYDFTLQPGSAAINAGVTAEGITDDCTDGRPDSGAIEYGSSAFSAGHNFSSPPNPAYSLSLPKHRNLINDGGFELNNLSAYWTKTGAQLGTLSYFPHWGYGLDVGEARSQYYGLRLGGSSADDGVEQTITGLEPNTTYKATCWLRSPDGATAEFGVKDYGGSTVTDSSTINNWTLKQVTFTTGSSNTSAVLYFKKSGSNTEYVYCDDAGVQYVGNRINMIPNNSFEYADGSSNPSYWTLAYGTDFYDGAEVSSDISYASSKSLKITDADNQKAVGVRSAGIAAVPGRFYTANAYCYIPSGSASFYIEFWDNNGTRLAENHTTLNSNGSWTKVEASGIAPAGTVSVTLMCYSSIGNTGTCYFDSTALNDAIPGDSFEAADGNNNPLGWTVVSGSDFFDGAEVSEDMSCNGIKSLKIIDVDNQKAVGVRSASIAAVPGRFYIGSANCYIPSGSASLYIEFWDSNGTRLAENHTTLNSNGSWTKVEASGMAPVGTTSVTLFCYSSIANTGICYFDTVTLDDAIAGSSFESADGSNNPSDWMVIAGSGFFDGAEVSTDISHSGLKSLKITDTNANAAVGVRSTSIAAVPGRLYSGYAYCYIPSGSINLYIEFWDSNGTRLDEHHTTLYSAGTWTKIDASGIAPAGTISATILLYSSVGNTGTSYFDMVGIDKYGLN